MNYKEFGRVFYEQTKRLIDKNYDLEKRKFLVDDFKEKQSDQLLNENQDKLIKEVMDHGNFCKECVKYFHGRNDIIDKVDFSI